MPDGERFDLYEGPSGALLGEFTSAQLQRGLEITLPTKDTAKVLLVQPHD